MPYLERLLLGVLDYANTKGGWSFTRMHEQVAPSLDQLQHWRGDGALVAAMSARDVEIVRGLPFPVVNLSGHVRAPGLPTVMVDHAAIGRLAAEHLIQQHFRRFGFYGFRGPLYSDQRRDAFMEAVQRAGGHCDVFDTSLAPSQHTLKGLSRLDTWIRRLRPPVGVLACTDMCAWVLAEKRKRTLSDIAAACGFHDLRRFRLTFVRVTGQTPAEFVKSACGRGGSAAGPRGR